MKSLNLTKNKTVNRIIILNFSIVNFLVFFRKDFFNELLNKPNFFQGILVFWLTFTAISVIYWWFFLFWHWKKQIFGSFFVKVMWFIIIFFGTMAYFFGPLIYYCLVVEKFIPLRKK